MKVHLDAEEVKEFLGIDPSTAEPWADPPRIVDKMFKRLSKAIEEDPSILTDRTPAQIAAALKKEEIAAQEKQKVLLSGQDWKKVKVKVEVEE